MRTIVLVKHVPDTELPRHLDTATGAIDMSGDNVLDEINSRALTWALDLRNAAGGEVIALTMGPKAATESLRAALAIGANEAVHIIDDAQPGPDAIASSAVLAAPVKLRRPASGGGSRPAKAMPPPSPLGPWQLRQRAR